MRRARPSYSNIRVANLRDDLVGHVEAVAVEEWDGLLRFPKESALDAAAVAVMTGQTLAGGESRRTADWPLPRFQLIADENREGGGEVTFPGVMLEKGIALQPSARPGWWRVPRGFWAVIQLPRRR